MIYTTDQLRSFADHPSASGFVPIGTETLRAVADKIDSLRAAYERVCGIATRHESEAIALRAEVESVLSEARKRVAELEAARVNDAKVYTVPVEAAALLADLRDELERVRLAYMEDARAMRQRNGELREVLHGLISVRFNEDAAEVEAAYDAAKEALRAGLSAPTRASVNKSPP